jgi:hypothetical protein
MFLSAFQNVQEYLNMDIIWLPNGIMSEERNKFAPVVVL